MTKAEAEGLYAAAITAYFDGREVPPPRGSGKAAPAAESQSL